MSASIRVNTVALADRLLIEVAGEISTHESTVLRAALREALATKPRLLVVSLAGVTFMATAGVATLVECLQGANKAQCKLVLCGMEQRVKSVFEISRLTKVFTIVERADDAPSPS